MTNYQHIAVFEASREEMTKKFIEIVKFMDKNVAIGRILALLSSCRDEKSFIQLIGEFNSLMSHQTSGDDYKE
jgi:hypothetical protein